ncbi:AMP-binding protein [Roseiarcaceae bacterium H3SJ34-1]|uniref:AMP-binding protein n=1 Tax=Terripilifer ovatus TaxID=3032367 RepID=UPI003AB98BB5|nr:AMP-binding protein [Roseiarcaceae bacterium H3SJ34-1]
MTIGATLSRHAADNPAGHAIVCDGEVISWRDLHHLVSALASQLAGLDDEPRAVALHLSNGPAFVPLFLAIARAGREAQVLDPAWPPSRTQSVLALLDPALLITADPGIRHRRRIVLDKHDLRFDAAAEGLRDIVPVPRATLADIDDLAPFYVGFTSGSTGAPKGYRRHHRSWIQSFDADAVEFGINAGDVIYAPGAMTHSLFLYAAMHAMHVGAPLVMNAVFRPDRAVEFAARHKASVLYGVPTHFRMMVTAMQEDGAKPLLSPRWLLSSGAKLNAEESARMKTTFPQARIAEFYGASELSFIAVRKEGDGAPATSVGRPFASVSVSIRDDVGKPLTAGETGHIFVESPLVFMGYATGVGSHLLRSGDAVSVGDVGSFDAQGFLHLSGRANRMILSSGKNIFPEEIETVLQAHPAVAAAAVFAAPDEDRGERLVALLSLAPEAALTQSEIIAHCRRLLPLPNIPRIYLRTETWRTTGSGKTDFAAMAALMKTMSMERIT